MCYDSVISLKTNMYIMRFFNLIKKLRCYKKYIYNKIINYLYKPDGRMTKKLCNEIYN